MQPDVTPDIPREPLGVHYFASPPTWIMHEGENAVEIRHRSAPRKSEVGCAAIMLLFGGAILIGFALILDSQLMARVFTGFIFGCGPLAILGVFVAYWFIARKGPHVLIERESGNVRLPRQNRTFDRPSIVQLQGLTRKHRSQDLAELNLVVVLDGRIDRWPIAGTNDASAMQRIGEWLEAETGIPFEMSAAEVEVTG